MTDKLLETLQELTGQAWRIGTHRCPNKGAHSHGDVSKSFSISRRADGRLRFKCFTPTCLLSEGGDAADFRRIMGMQPDPGGFEQGVDPFDAARLEVLNTWGKGVTVERLELSPIGVKEGLRCLETTMGRESRRHWLFRARTEDPMVPFAAEWRSKPGTGKKVVFRCCVTSRGVFVAADLSGVFAWDRERSTWRKLGGKGSRAWRIVDQAARSGTGYRVFYVDHGKPVGQHCVLELPEGRKPYIFHTEGPKDARAVAWLGLNSSAVFNGAGAELTREQVEDHRGREVFLLGDNDEAGDRRLVKVQKQLAAAGIVAARVPGFLFGEKKGADVYDWIAEHRRNGAGKDSIRALFRVMLGKPTGEYPGATAALEEGRRMI